MGVAEWVQRPGNVDGMTSQVQRCGCNVVATSKEQRRCDIVGVTQLRRLGCNVIAMLRCNIVVSQRHESKTMVLHCCDAAGATSLQR